ncbi:MAG: carboxypeptidase regulatory-like domain-containing protein [Myxococcales bacterium]|nr:carboxypeptidase regulatory-like domain-containing protein [Myxococcales bacterium]
MQATAIGPVLLGAAALGLGAFACADKELDASARTEPGAACEPEGEPCDEGLACELVVGSMEHMCAARVEIRGSVIDAIDDHPIEGAHVVAVDELGAPVTRVVQTDAQGRYALPVGVPRDAEGRLVHAPRWTLLVAAAGYLRFPGPLRPALPIDAQVAVASDDPTVQAVIDDASTTVALLPATSTGGVTITGQVEGELAAGTLVVAEGLDPVSLAVADLDGAFTLFNVPAGAATLRGYRRGLDVEPVALTVGDADIADVRLVVRAQDVAALGVVEGSVNIVDAPGGSTTSVVLVPSSVFDPHLERGPVPVGLRAPAPPEAPSVSSAFQIDGVPSGRYHVLAAFENDGLVRDPDASIAGTQLQQVEVGLGEVVALPESFKITAALAIVAPGADAPEPVDAAPVLSWIDDASEDRYEVVVHDARGEEIWRDAEIPAVSGAEAVELPYGGPALTSGMYYQFRVTSWRDTPQGSTALSRSEDLLGVFVVR